MGVRFLPIPMIVSQSTVFSFNGIFEYVVKVSVIFKPEPEPKPFKPPKKK